MAQNRQVETDTQEKLARGLGWFSIGLGLAEILAPRSVSRMIGVPEKPGLLRTMGMRELASGLGIFSRRRPAGAVWSRVAGDAIDLALLSSAFASRDTNKNRAAIAAASVLGVTALDVACAQRLSRDKADRAIRTQAVTINRPVDEVYRYWRNLENLPRFMEHLESVRETGGNRSHWAAKGPAGTTVEWDAEIVQDRPGEMIAWRSLPGADIRNSGYVHFQSAPGGRGAEIHVLIEYSPPAGAIGAGIAKIFGKDPGQQVKGDLRRFKQVMETGEVVHSDASIHHGPHPGQPPAADDEDLERARSERPQSPPGAF